MWVRWLRSLPLLFLSAQLGYPFAKLTPEASAAFDRYVSEAESRMERDAELDSTLRGGEVRVEPVPQASGGGVPGGIIQDWTGTMFVPGATLRQVRSVLRDYSDYKKFYFPKVIESNELAHTGDEYDVFLRLSERLVVPVVLNSTYHVRYSQPDARHLTVTSRSTRIAEVRDPGNSYADEMPPGDDSGFLWRLNTYWRFTAADGGVYAACEAVSLSRDVPLGLGWMLKGFLESFPKDSMLNTLHGTRAAIEMALDNDK